MSTRRIALATVLGIALALLPVDADGPPPKSSHPYFNDQGALAWYSTLEEAKRAALASNKIVFVEYGRKTCVDSQRMCEEIITKDPIRARLSAIAVGLAADCDKPDAELEKLFRAHLAGATATPFVGFVTPDLKWVGGWSGMRWETEFQTTLEEVEKNPMLDASPTATKQLEGMLGVAKKAAEMADWKVVAKAGRDASRIWGRSAARTELIGVVALARTWASEQLALALKAAQDPFANVLPVRASLNAVAAAFTGEPEAEDAKRGIKAIDRIGSIRNQGDGNEAEAARTKALAEFKGTRWEVLFTSGGK